MKSMMISEEEKKEASVHSYIDDRPRYPYGLRLNIGPEEYKKLGLSDIPAVGGKMVMLAMVEIVSVYKEETKDDVPRMNIGLQITDMELKEEEEKKEKKDPAKALYGDEDGDQD